MKLIYLHCTTYFLDAFLLQMILNFFKAFKKFIYLLIFGWARYSLLCNGLSLVVASGGCPSCSVQTSHCGGFSCCGAQALRAWAQFVVLGFYCPVACGIFPDQGLNL